MRKAILALAGAMLCLAGCGEKEADPNILTDVYAPVLEAGYTDIRKTDTGYYAVEYKNNIRDFYTISGETEAETYFRILELDGEGSILEETPLEPESWNAPSAVGDRGIYLFASENLYHMDWEGNVMSQISADSIRPAYVSDMAHLVVQETEKGLVVGWDDQCTVLTEDLAAAEQWEFSGAFEAMAVEGEAVWVVCAVQEDGETVWKLEKWEHGVSLESWILPEELWGLQRYGEGCEMIACEDGVLYGWSRARGVFRWAFGREDAEVETELSFSASSVSSSNVIGVQKLPGEDLYMLTHADLNRYDNFASPERQMQLMEKAPDKDLSEMMVLTLACVEPSENVEEAVLRFNRTHPDAYIRIVSYNQYSSMNDQMAGYDRFDLDLHTGLLEADILVNKTFSPMDLYPYMTGEIQPEDIAQCVKNSYEQEGKLLSFGPFLSFSSPIGRRDALDGMTHWDLETFLDFRDGLEEGEFLTEYLSRENADYLLFNNGLNCFFIRDGKACYDDPLYLRVLSFLAGLPEEGMAYFDRGINTMGALIAGETDQLLVEPGEENLYWNGKIKLYGHEYGNTQHIYNIGTLLRFCMELATTDVTLIGYPTIAESGVHMGYIGDSYCIPSTCKAPALAWEFVEDAVLGAIAEMESEIGGVLTQYPFTSLTEPYMQYLESMRGYQMRMSPERGGTAEGWDLEAVEGTMLLSVDDNIIPLIRHLYDSAGYTASVSKDIRLIVREEQSRYLAGAITAEECADIVQSRVSIYLSERE